MNTRSKGRIGETLACNRLEKEGYKILARNYLKKWGEVDIIAEKDKILHFVEVKSVTDTAEAIGGATSRHRPEENVHSWKMRHIGKMVQTYLAETKRDPETEFQFHVMCVYMNLETKKARIKWIKNVIL